MNKIFILIFLLFCHDDHLAHAGLYGQGLTDYQGNGISSHLFSGTKNPSDVEIVDSSGVVVGPAMSIAGVNYMPVSPPIDVTSSPINITTQDLVSTTATGFANQSLISGTPTSGSTATYTVNSIQTVMVLVSGTWTGTLSMEVSEDGGSTYEPRGIHVIGTSTFSATITANVAGSMNAAGKSNVRVRSTTAMTGTAVVKIVMSDNPSNFYIANSLKLVDGSATPNVNTLAIKAGSTLSAPTDTAAVVTLRDTVTVQGPSGSAGTPSGGILTIQGVSGGTKIPTTTSVGNSGTPTQTSVSCASTTTTLLAASTATNFISIRNPTTATNTIWINVAGVAAVVGAPSIDLAPGAEASFMASENSFLPTAQINCISGGTASSVSLVYK